MTKNLNYQIWMQRKEVVKSGLNCTQWYCEGALELMTQRCAKSCSKVTGFAGHYAATVWS